MVSRLLRGLAVHIHQNLGLYTLIFLSFLVGTVFGALGVSGLTAHQEGELINYLNVFLSDVVQWEIDSVAMAQQAVMNNVKFIFFIWFLGLTVIGVPLVLGVVAVRGFVLGFTVGFLVQEKSTQGLLLALLSVLPQNLFNIPALIASGVAAVSFSLWLIRGRLAPRSPNLLQQLVAYSLWVSTMALVATAGGLVEAYVSPFFARLIASYFG
ncbi:hypothetical protein SY88_07110 [Clostridiales bacterium PH28_bin88]|nr:hypothetical protein SY88_07110 [Clostridiales bacterium PH28_bin88]